jgi:dihydroxy-acid dehydratase
MLDPTSKIASLCRRRNIIVVLMTDAQFSRGSVGIVIGLLARSLPGGPIALVENGDTIIVNVKENWIDCLQLDDYKMFERRFAA